MPNSAHTEPCVTGATRVGPMAGPHGRRLLVGLGNINSVGGGTPHNFGREIVSRAVGDGGWSWWWGALSWYKQAGCGTVLLPGLPMNLSGWCVARAVALTEAEAAADVLIVSDDLRLPFGRVADAATIRCAHRGLTDIAAHLKTDKVALVRVGAARAPPSPGPYRGVLTPLAEAETRVFDGEVVPQAVGRCREFLRIDDDSS